MLTSAMSHQKEALRRSAGKKGFAYFCEQGTGKTWMFLADAERAYGAGEIEGLLVIAPKGVDSNWVRLEIPTHLGGIALAACYRNTKESERQIAAMMRPRRENEMPPLRVLAMNYEALNTKKGFETAINFLRTVRSMIVLDESRRIKNPSSARSKRIMELKPHAVLRRIGTGTPVANAPLDVFNQFEFLGSGLLGTTSYRAFVAEYAELVPEDSHLMRHIKKRINNNFARPQVVATDLEGNKVWRNLDKLQALMAPHTFRVLKRDCLDLPEKIYRTHFFEMSREQRAMYEQMKSELRIEHEGDLLTLSKLSLITKLQQVTSGFFLDKAGDPRTLINPIKETPRLAALREIIEDLPEDEHFIIFARFRHELFLIAQLLTELGIAHGRFHGGIKDKERDEAVDGFQSGRLRSFVAQQASGGIGLTLTKASTVIYYSNTYDLEERLQSEDRAHRKGTTKNVVYIDLAAENSIDLEIASALQRKSVVSQLVLKDAR